MFKNLSKQLVILLVIGATVLLQACKKDDEAPMLEITIEASTDLIIGINQELQLTASVDGEVVAPETLTWTSSDVISAEVSDQGVVTSLRHGVVTITATAADGVSSGEYPLQVFNIAGDGLLAFDEEVIDFMRNNPVLGASYAVVKDGKLVMVRGYGLANVDTREVIRPTSLFRITDLSKIITATAIMKLVDDGQLNLNERMFDILIDKLPTVNLPDVRITDITVGQLLNHTSGFNGSASIPQPMFNQALVAIEQGVASPPSLDEMMTWFANQTLTANPGESHQFNNMNYMLLGRIIEAKTDQTYEEYVKETILDPIGVTDAVIGLSHERDKFAREVTYYHPFTPDVLSVFDSDAGFVPFPYGGIGDIQNMDAHGGWIASVVDLARLAIAIDGDPATPEILSAASQAAMVEEDGSGIGFGWFVQDDNWNQWGLMPGSMGTMHIQDDGLIIIGLLNTTLDLFDPRLQNQIETFRDDLRELASQTTWPDEDLFDDY